MILQIYTLIHVLTSLVGILSGMVVLVGLIAENQRRDWTALFLTSTVLTSATGFFFPAKHILPSHIVGGISMFVLALACYARYARRLNAGWRKTYAICAVLALYLNIFVAIVQAFLKIPTLKEFAPTQTEPPFKLTQLVVLLLFVVLGILATVNSNRKPVDAV